MKNFTVLSDKVSNFDAAAYFVNPNAEKKLPCNYFNVIDSCFISFNKTIYGGTSKQFLCDFYFYTLGLENFK
jgi:hypothetical protein